jgi:hypothetical protein
MTVDLAAVNPDTGEVLEHLDQQPAETLAEALDAIHTRQTELARWADALAAELRRRLKVRQTTLAVFGDWEVAAARKRESEWDADELEPVLQQLTGDGTIRAGDWVDVITRTPVVSRSRAGALLTQLDGAAADAVKACRTWKEKPGPLTVTRSVQLNPATVQRGLPGPGPLADPPQPPPNLEDLFA